MHGTAETPSSWGRKVLRERGSCTCWVSIIRKGKGRTVQCCEATFAMPNGGVQAFRKTNYLRRWRISGIRPFSFRLHRILFDIPVQVIKYYCGAVKSFFSIVKDFTLSAQGTEGFLNSKRSTNVSNSFNIMFSIALDVVQKMVWLSTLWVICTLSYFCFFFPFTPKQMGKSQLLSSDFPVFSVRTLRASYFTFLLLQALFLFPILKSLV